MDDANAPEHVITCALFANKPNYSGGKITGTGGISGCAPSTPDAGSSARQHNCPPPARSTTAPVNCDSTSTTYSYRTVTLATIVHEGTDSGTATSANST
ncbi:hypothetical protein ACGFWE_42120 [Streptomyces sp. NPDC048523]|uniref:hypothetical protein n=1 Tax=Streptomyces sp. NPDC048523 TaxID=3365567 RepID=UPI00371E14A7